MTKESEFLDGLRQEFFDDARDKLQSCEEMFLSYDQKSNKSDLDEIKRLLHSLKGSAQAVELKPLAGYLHQIETAIDHNKTGNDRNYVSLLLSCIDVFKQYLDQLEENEPPESIEEEIRSRISKL